MVKNIPTIERSTKIRFGKHATDDQGENTIVFNASNAAIDTSVPGSIYMTPLRQENDITSRDITMLTYNTETKEIIDSNVPAVDLFSINLQYATNNDNVTSNTVRFINDTTAFVTTGNVGIHNTSPTHALDVGSQFHVTEGGEVRIGPSVLIDSSVTNQIQVSGRIDTDSITLDHIGIANNNPTITGLSLGSTTFLQNPTASINAFSTSGNVSAAFYHGDSYFLSNLTLDNIILQGNTAASKTVEFNKSGTSLITASNVGIANGFPVHTLDVGSNLFVDDIGSDILNVTGNVNATNYLKSKKLEVSEDAIISGNVNASGNIETTSGFFKGDGGILSNVTLQQVTDAGNTTSNTVQFTNAHTAFTTDLTSNVGVKLNQLANVTLETDITLENEQILVYDGSNWTNQNLNHTFLRVKAEEAIQKGNVVYVTSSTGNNTFNVKKANATDSLTMPAIGVAYENLAVNGEGLIVSFGRADGMLLDGFVESETVYVSNVGDGLVSNVKPLASTDLIQNVGIVIKPHASSGIISVTGVGRSNDIPNAEEVYAQPTYVYVNSSGNELKKILASNLSANNQTLDMVTSWSNSTQNTIQSTHATTGFISSGNVHVGSNIFVSGIKDPLGNGLSYIPMIEKGTGKLIRSPAHVDNDGTYIINAPNAEFTGNLSFIGNTYVFESNTVVINDRILGIANNNTSHTLDVGIIMEHPGHNIAFVHHGEPEGEDLHEHEMVLGYTQNTVSDNHVLDDANIITFRVLGNVIVQNNLTLTSGDLTAITVNSNVVGYNVSAITLNGNVVSDNVVATNMYGTIAGSNAISASTISATDSVTSITTSGNVVVSGNVTATKFIGDGGTLSNVQTATPTLASVVDEGNATTNVVQFSNATTGIEITSNIDFVNKITLKSTSETKSNLFVVNAIQLDPSYASPTRNVLSFDTTTGEIYDSGGQGGGGSSFNNITEENANVLIGSNLTINSLGSNVLTVSGNVSADNITIGGVVTNVVTANTITLTNNLTVSGNTTSQNIKLTNTDITASVTSGTITIDAKEKTYGTAPLVVSTTDVSNLVFSNLITGAQIVIPILASGGAINISSAMTNVSFYAMTSDVSVTQDKHALMTLSNLYGNIYMNAIGFS